MAFDIDGARAAGYSDDEIADHLGGQSNFDTAGARKAGYTSAEILAQLTKVPQPKAAAPAPAPAPAVALAPAPSPQATANASQRRGLADAQGGGLGAVRAQIADSERVRAEGMDPNRMWERRLGEIKPEPVRLEDYGMVGPEKREALTRHLGAMTRPERIAYQDDPRAPEWARYAAALKPRRLYKIRRGRTL